MNTYVLRLLSIAVCTMALAATSWAGQNLLSEGDFNTPNDETWTNSAWGAWGGPSGRATWADRGGSGRGGAAYGWNTVDSLGFFQDIAGTYGVTYTFTIWIKKEVNYNEDYTELKLEWRDSSFIDLGDTVTTNLAGQAGSTWQQFTISGKTTNTACVYVRPVVYTQWNTPTNTSTASIQFDDASLVAEPATVIQISNNDALSFPVFIGAALTE